jgi:hypothetical protein
LVKDIKLAEVLGMSSDRLRSIRTLIKRNIKEIEEDGPALQREAVVGRPQGGGTEGAEYWLTESQALTVCQLSRAPNAEAVRRMLTRVFMA